MSQMASDIGGVFELQLVTPQYEAMLGFYADVLGLEPMFTDERRRRTHFELGAGQLIVAEEGAEQVLPGWPGVPPSLHSESDETVAGPRAHGPVHYALHTGEEQWLEACRTLEADAGAEWRGPQRWGEQYGSLYLRDPDGNVVELICSLQ